MVSKNLNTNTLSKFKSQDYRAIDFNTKIIQGATFLMTVRFRNRNR